MRNIAIGLLLLGSATALFAADEEAAKKIPGIAVGEKAPDFALRDQKGQLVKLSAMLKRGPVALVFHRSASW